MVIEPDRYRDKTFSAKPEDKPRGGVFLGVKITKDGIDFPGKNGVKGFFRWIERVFRK